MAFTTWAAELARFKNAMAERTLDSFWLASTENSKQMRTTYTLLGNITAFEDWLEQKAAEEAAGEQRGVLNTCIGGF
jgi:hypothetical protein